MHACQTQQGTDVIGKFCDHYQGRRCWNKNFDIWNASGVIGGRDIAPGYRHGLFITIAKIYPALMIGKRHRNNFAVAAHFAALRQTFYRSFGRALRQSGSGIETQGQMGGIRQRGFERGSDAIGGDNIEAHARTYYDARSLR
ncbi:hypothetical protein DK59_3125 [Brucella abortus bv. 4 str. 292]|nr:hypothetical protein DK59_3125 [Brucella abortus bv. 4 str. 292]